MQEEIIAEEKSAEFICANLASIRTFEFRKYIPTWLIAQINSAKVYHFKKQAKIIFENLFFKWFAHII